MIQILQNLLLRLPFRILCISRAFSLVKITATQRPPPAILKCYLLGEHHGEGRRGEGWCWGEAVCFTACRLPALSLQMQAWLPLMLALVLSGTAGQCLLGAHPAKGLRLLSSA